MKSQWLFTLATILVLVGVISLIISWHGTMSVTGAFPTSSSSVQLAGSANGGWAVVGLFCFVGGLVLLVISLVRALIEPFRRSPPPPALPERPISSSHPTNSSTEPPF
jgi:hypothetical protein